MQLFFCFASIFNLSGSIILQSLGTGYLFNNALISCSGKLNFITFLMCTASSSATGGAKTLSFTKRLLKDFKVSSSKLATVGNNESFSLGNDASFSFCFLSDWPGDGASREGEPGEHASQHFSWSLRHRPFVLSDGDGDTLFKVSTMNF